MIKINTKLDFFYIFGHFLKSFYCVTMKLSLQEYQWYFNAYVN